MGETQLQHALLSNQPFFERKSLTQLALIWSIATYDKLMRVNKQFSILCIDADKLFYLFCLVDNILANYLFNRLWSLSTRGLEIPRFAICIDLFWQRFENSC